jgi:hypothetical protein
MQNKIIEITKIYNSGDGQSPLGMQDSAASAQPQLWLKK